MEFRTQDNEMKTSGSFSYGHLSKESVGGERKKIGNHNGTNNTTQTLDYPHDFQQQLNHGPNPDRFTQIGGKPKSKNPSNSTIRYRECLKNHAATIGGNVFDGCGEFMPSGEEGTLEALKCAACECHRNFHRKEVDGDQSHHYTSPSSRLSNLVLSPHHHHHQKFPIGFHGNPNNAPVIVQPMSVAFGGHGGGVGGGNESSSEDLNMFQSSVEAVMRSSPPFSLSKKRFRTKFTQEQKEKMLEFAEKLEWRFQKQEEEAIERFCAEVGVKRQVFKVWMHNNKSNNIKKQNDESLNQSLEHMVEPVREERLELDR